MLIILAVFVFVWAVAGCRPGTPLTGEKPSASLPAGSSPDIIDEEPTPVSSSPADSSGGQDTSEPVLSQDPQPSTREPEPVLSPGVELQKKEGETAIGPFFGILPELAWSPDGRYLAIYGEAKGYGLWVWDRVEGNIRRLLKLVDRSGEGKTAVAFFGWRRDGRELIYAVDGVQPDGLNLGQTGVTIYAINLEGSERRLAWLPGGPELIRSQHFNAETGWLLLHRGNELWRLNVDTGETRRLKGDLPSWDGFFSITPDPKGELVVYPEPEPTGHGLILLDVASGKEMRVAVGKEFAFGPVWSPDGKKLAFLSAAPKDEGKDYDFQVGEDGPLPPATRLNIVDTGGNQLASWRAPHGEKVGAPVWSPDGERLAFLSARVAPGPDGFEEVRWQRLFLAGLDGSLVELGPAQGEWLAAAGFSPDGARVLVYRYVSSGGVTILAYGPHPNQVEVLATEAVDESLVWWEGRLLTARLAPTFADTLDTQIYLISLDGRAEKLTASSGWKSRFFPFGSLLAYLSADNQVPPYPITVMVRNLP
jgi:WD40 repeat protein